jgi:hypothetical protein
MHLYLRSGTSSALNLAFCSPGLADHHDWSVLLDLHGSNHCLVFLHFSTLAASRHPQTVSPDMLTGLVSPSNWFLKTRNFHPWIPWWSISWTLCCRQPQNIPPVIHHTSLNTSPVLDRWMLWHNSHSEVSCKTFSSQPCNGGLDIIWIPLCQVLPCHIWGQAHIMEGLYSGLSQSAHLDVVWNWLWHICQANAIRSSYVALLSLHPKQTLPVLQHRPCHWYTVLTVMILVLAQLKNSTESLPLYFISYITEAFRTTFIWTSYSIWMLHNTSSVPTVSITQCLLTSNLQEFLLPMYNHIWTELSTRCPERKSCNPCSETKQRPLPGK